MGFAVGDRVQIHPMWWNTGVQWFSMEGIGEVTNANPTMVKWPNDFMFLYLEDQLIHAEEVPNDVPFDLGAAIANTGRIANARIVLNPFVDDDMASPNPTATRKATPPTPVPPATLRNGTVVIFNPHHVDYQQYHRQHEGNQGVIVDDSHRWLEVRWSHGESNNYTADMLIPVFDANVLSSDIPGILLPGTKVMLSTVCPLRIRLNMERDFDVNNLYLVGFDESPLSTRYDRIHDSLKQWKRMYVKDLKIVLVALNEPRKMARIYFRDVTPIPDTPLAKVDIIATNGMQDYFIINDNPDSWNIADNDIINNGKHFTNHITYDDAWRKDILEHMQ